MDDQQSSVKKAKRSITLSFATVTVIFVVILSGFGWAVYDSRQNAARDGRLLDATTALSKQNADLLAQNAQRIKDIQASRTASCKKTYSGIREVFQPFIPAHPTEQRQIEFVGKFNDTIDKLIRGCVKQTKPKVTKPKKEGAS